MVEVVCARVTRRGRGAMAVGRMGGETGCGGSDGKGARWWSSDWWDGHGATTDGGTNFQVFGCYLLLGLYLRVGGKIDGSD